MASSLRNPQTQTTTPLTNPPLTIRSPTHYQQPSFLHPSFTKYNPLLQQCQLHPIPNPGTSQASWLGALHIQILESPVGLPSPALPLAISARRDARMETQCLERQSLSQLPMTSRFLRFALGMRLPLPLWSLVRAAVLHSPIPTLGGLRSARAALEMMGSPIDTGLPHLTTDSQTQSMALALRLSTATSPRTNSPLNLQNLDPAAVPPRPTQVLTSPSLGATLLSTASTRSSPHGKPETSDKALMEGSMAFPSLSTPPAVMKLSYAHLTASLQSKVAVVNPTAFKNFPLLRKQLLKFKPQHGAPASAPRFT